jgi:predicted nucleotidyltransferase component of viral defense system
MNRVEQAQDKILGILAGEIDDFYLLGGTALAKYYLHHRLSEDLDFFTQNFDYRLIQAIKELLSAAVKKPLEVIRERVKAGKMVRLCIYYVPLGKNHGMKIDFVEDIVKPVKEFQRINGINVMSLEDIYLRKIHAVTGTQPQIDLTGRKTHFGRQEAKDFYDLYFLSHTFRNLSDFALKYCDSNQLEGLIYWFRTYSRQEIKEGLMDLMTFKKFDFYQMERHFKKEIDRLIEQIT